MNNSRGLLEKEVRFWAKTALGRRDPVVASTKRLAQEWRDILAASHVSAPAASGKRVLFLTGNGLNAIFLSMETFLLKSLQLRGHECQALICNSGLPSCEFDIGGSGRYGAGKLAHGVSPIVRSQACRNCAGAARTAMESIGARVRGLDEFPLKGGVEALKEIAERIPLQEIKDFVYKGIKVGDHAFSSTLRITLRGFLDFESDLEMRIYRRQLLSSMVMVDRFNASLDAFRPDKVVCTHGVYLTHGVAADVCNQRGLDIVIYGVPYRKGTLWLSHKETYHRSLVTDPVVNWENLRMTPEMDKVLDVYLASKTAGGRDNVNYHPNPITENDKVVKSLGIDPSLPVVSMFTNVIWDAQIYYQFNAFENIFDWIFSSIEYFGKRPDVQLVIRIHPAETKGGMTTAQPMAPEIKRRFPGLPKNIFVIPAESDISSYTVAEMSCAALIFGTKMGLEIALKGIPVIVAGETLNRRKGFTYDVETRPGYFDLLDRITTIPRNSEDMINRVRRFAYYLFFQRMIDMPLLNANLNGYIRPPEDRYFNFHTLEELMEGRDAHLDLICDGIMNAKPFIAR